jgi:hypothetical protein
VAQLCETAIIRGWLWTETAISRKRVAELCETAMIRGWLWTEGGTVAIRGYRLK